MTDTNVRYHVESGSPGRPAINVKDHHAGDDYRSALERLVGAAGADAIEAAGYEVYERVVSDFWQAAEEIATQRGLGEIVQGGRSGGWLVFADGRDPQYMTGGENRDSIDDGDDALTRAAEAERLEWLAGYRAMVEWADAYIAAAPGRVAALAQSIAMDEKGAPAAARWGFHA